MARFAKSTSRLSVKGGDVPRSPTPGARRINATDVVARLEAVKATIERSAQLLAELSVMLLGGF